VGIFCLAGLISVALAAAPVLTVAVAPAPVGGIWRPGAVVRVEVRSEAPLTRIEGAAFDHQAIAFILAEDGHRATGLLGLAADVAPGDYTITVHAETTGHTRLDGTQTITVGKPLFRSQTLKVDPRFVQPPADELPRIEHERARLAELSHAIDRDRPWHTPFSPPLASPVTEAFGVRRTFNGQLASQHRGVDLKGAMGTPIAAPGAGKVVLAADLYYTGNTVVIDHGSGVVSLLAHMSRVLVQEGQLVDAGAIVGEVGATGRVTGPHLHWSAWVAGTSIDPLGLVRAINNTRPAGTSARPPARTGKTTRRPRG
jgi:murein DD-endopeptidase MepM/ murein hydrolase activator NlpD